MLEGKKILVTGAGGFIGSHLVEALVRAGAQTTCLLHYNAASSIGQLQYADPKLLPEMNLLFGDVRDTEFVDSAVEDQDVVLHLAALIGIPYSYKAPRSYVQTNVEGTLNLLEAARRHHVQRFVHTSTSEVYGTALTTPIDETHPLQAQSPYAASKIAADKLAESYQRSFGLPVVTIRPFNTFGPRQSTRALVPTIISQAIGRDEIHLGALTPKRDLTYVDDTVSAFLAAAVAENVEGNVINLGTGRCVTVGECADRILALLGSSKTIVCDESRLRPESSEVEILVANNGKAWKTLGWAPKIAFDEGLSRTIEHISQSTERHNVTRYGV